MEERTELEVHYEVFYPEPPDECILDFKERCCNFLLALAAYKVEYLIES